MPTISCRTPRPGRRGRPLGLLLVVCLLAACAPDRGGSQSATGSPAAPATGGTVQPGGSAAKFGDLPSPCKKGSAKGQTEQGVTDSEILIGYGDDRGYKPAPGLMKEMSDAVEALIKWCNDQGGINGRKVVGKMYDAAGLNANQQMQAACPREFMMVGYGWVGDATAEATRVGCNMVVVPGYSTSPDTIHGQMAYFAFPGPLDVGNGASWKLIAETVPETKDGVILAQTTLPAVQAGNQRVAAELQAAGFASTDCGVVMNAQGEPSAAPFALRYKECGKKVIHINSTPRPQFFDLIRAMNESGSKPIMVNASTWYGEAAKKWNASGQGDGMYVFITHQALENTDVSPAMKTYVDLVTANGGKTSPNGVSASSAFLLWASAADKCGAQLTRQCMVNELSKVKSWTAGGLHGETNPAENLPTSCAMLLQLKGSEYKQVAPAKRGELYCAPTIKVPESAWGGVKLNEKRQSPKFLSPTAIVPKN